VIFRAETSLQNSDIDNLMSSIGCSKKSNMTYSIFPDSKDVCRYILFMRYGAGRSMLAAFFAFRQMDVEIMSYNLFKAHRGTPIPGKDSVRNKFFMKFNLEFLEPQPSPWPLFMDILQTAEALEIIRKEIEAKLKPMMATVSDSQSLYSLLLSDDEPCSWYRTNGAIRAVYLLRLGQKIGVPLAKTREYIQPHKGIIQAGLGGADVEIYLDRVCFELERQ
jgi:hypothetical protein